MCTISSMQISDLAAVQHLVQNTEGLAFKDWEGTLVLARFLERCAGLSQVAYTQDGELVGCVFIAEGLMAMVHHLAVRPDWRGRGLATALVQSGLRALYREPLGAKRVYVTVLESNVGALEFWTKFGADKKADGPINMFTMDLGEQAWLKAPVLDFHSAMAA